MRKSQLLFVGCIVTFVVAYYMWSHSMWQSESHVRVKPVQVTRKDRGPDTSTSTSTTSSSTTSSSTTSTRGEVAVTTTAASSSFPQTIVIPAGCTPYQYYQTAVAVGSLRRMQEKFPHLKEQFNVVRVIACADPKSRWIHDERLSDFHVAPEFTDLVNNPAAKTLNKPGALWHWLTQGEGAKLSPEHEVVMVDADFIFLDDGPIPLHLSKMNQIAAAHFLIGSFYNDPTIMAFCKGAGRCPSYDQKLLPKIELGPPYAARVQDAVGIVTGWYEITRAMVEAGDSNDWPGGWYADMHAFMFGVEREKEKRKDGKGLPPLEDPVQTWGWFLVNAQEKWDRVRQDFGDLKHSWCFHYAGNYKLNEFDKNIGYDVWWHKHMYKSDKTIDMMLSCNASESYKIWSQNDRGPIAFRPPAWIDYAPERFYDEVVSVKALLKQGAHADRQKWVMWTIYRGINDGLRRYRDVYCDGE